MNKADRGIAYFLISFVAAAVFAAAPAFAQEPSSGLSAPDPDGPTPPPLLEGAAAIDPPVGSFQVSDGIFWTENPPTFSCVETCAELFGGVESDYVCSTSSSTVNGGSWASEWGTARHCNVGGPFGGDGIPIADDYKRNDFYDCGSVGCSVSTYVSDNCGFFGEGTSENFCFARQVDQSRATFGVSKDFNDGNTGEVEVTLSCNTGLPLEQTTTISEGDPVNFVVVDFNDGELDCSVTEVVPAGYSVNYWEGTTNSDTSCEFADVNFGEAEFCIITNSLNTVEIEVTKVWIDENPQFNAQNVADADWSCSNVAFGQNNGFLQFFGNPGSDSFFVFPDWETGTTCSITEVALNESGVEVDDSDCQGLLVLPGEGASCTIFNTRLFEGIPTLSQYGLAVLALLMLGVGFIAFRRLI